VTDYQLLFAALTVVTVPMIIVYVVFNKQVVAGLTEGSLK
jgi:raffinose/stachyose/melibiose transport system permease protein